MIREKSTTLYLVRTTEQALNGFRGVLPGFKSRMLNDIEGDRAYFDESVAREQAINLACSSSIREYALVSVTVAGNFVQEMEFSGLHINVAASTPENPSYWELPPGACEHLNQFGRASIELICL